MLKRGDQIIYVPPHADGNLTHPDCEQGFVTSTKDNVAFCRYFSKFYSGLRTLANSEYTPTNLLVRTDHHPQPIIDALLEDL